MSEVVAPGQMASKSADVEMTDANATNGAPQLSAKEKENLKEMILRNLKRTREMFNQPYRGKPLVDDQAQRARIAVKLKEYAAVKDIQAFASSKESDQRSKGGSERREKSSAISRLADEIAEKQKNETNTNTNTGLVKYEGGNKSALAAVSDGSRKRHTTSAEIIKKLPSRWPKPIWHAPWKLYRVISGHLGWVRSIAFEPGNEWFATGSADRTIKIWDTASGQLKLTLTGHIEQIRALAVSDRHPYMFSCGDDQTVKCWDLEYNKVIRSYHGHLSGVYSMALHPSLDVLMTGGRDSVCRVWDIRTKSQVFCLTGHDNTVCSILTQNVDPQVVTGSHDSTIRLWDLAAGKTMSTLTHHKKSVRAMAMHPKEFTFASASVDNIKKFKLPEGQFLHNMTKQQKTIVNTMAINEDSVLVTGGDNGSLWFWDWGSGYNYHQQQTIVQPGSLDSEAGIYACTFDITGSRLVTCEADKTIKMYKEDTEATPESHPINFKPPTDLRRF